jgi:hypothetical protein
VVRAGDDGDAPAQGIRRHRRGRQAGSSNCTEHRSATIGVARSRMSARCSG